MAYLQHYDDFSAAGLAKNPESYQGRWCAHWCINAEHDAETWASQVLSQERGLHDSLLARDALLAMIDATRVDLEDENYAWNLLLPEDDDPVEQRVLALAAWCDAFVLGLAEAGLRDLDPLGTEAREFIADLQAIAQLDDAEADDEGAYVELVEYVRVGVFIMRSDVERHQDLH